MRRIYCLIALLVLAGSIPAFMPQAHAIEKQPAAMYHARRVALGQKLNGGVAVLFAAEEPLLDLDPYRQDEDFYYTTGWNEPGAALLIVSESSASGINSTLFPEAGHKYEEILFLPTRNMRMEKYTGIKLDAGTAGAAARVGVDEVRPMTDLPKVLNDLISADRRVANHMYTQAGNAHAAALVQFAAAEVGTASLPAAHDIAEVTTELREIKDAGEIDLLKKASEASEAAQRVMMKAVKPGVTEHAVAGKMYASWLEYGCERASYAPIVGSGINATTLHYAENTRTMEDGDIVVVDAACEYSMYASDITRTVPVSGHFTARQREIYDVVLGAQKAAIDAFVSGKSKIGDRYHTDPDGLDLVAYNYVNTHGKSLDGTPLGKYWVHPLSHMVGIDVHDPSNYPTVLEPGMVFTIEPGVYIPEEKIGVRIECVFLVGKDGKLIDLTADLPHTADEVEAAMKGK
jgi:Xaa-Pro aminopeptidase